MRFFLFLQKHFGRALLSAMCLLLQGCNNWFSSKSPEVVTNENSTVVGTSESEAVTDVPEEPIKPVRATPRRPIVVEEPVFEPIPVEEPTVSPIVPDGSTTYVVRKGDTLTKIAHRFHVSVLQLMQENQLKNKNKLRVGQVLAIPQGGSSTAPSSDAVEPYRVVKGDTLSKIAKRFQISLFELQQMNGFDRNATLSVGQMILVPKSASALSSTEKDGVYSVQKGDTLGKIAKKFGTTVAKLREHNHLKSDMIYVGQRLYLSGSAPVSEKSRNTPSKSDAAPIEGDTYTVQAGDNLWLIAKRCRRSVAELTRLNDLKNPEQLQVGQVLRLKERSSVFSERPSQRRKTSVRTYDEVPVKRHDEEPFVRDYKREPEPVAPSRTEGVDQPKPSSTFEEDDFKDLFEENKDMPVVPLDVQ